MKTNAQPLRIVWGHWTEGGTGITNLSPTNRRIDDVYTQAAANLCLDGITLVNRSLDGRPGHSLHDCARRNDLSDFWAEVRRLNGGQTA